MKSAAAATLSALPLPPPQKLHRRRSSALPTLKKVSTDGDHHFEFCLQEFICDEIRNSRSASRTAASSSSLPSRPLKSKNPSPRELQRSTLRMLSLQGEDEEGGAAEGNLVILYFHLSQ